MKEKAKHEQKLKVENYFCLELPNKGEIIGFCYRALKLIFKNLK